MDYSTLTARLMQAKFHVILSNNGVAMQCVRRLPASKHQRAKRGTVSGFSQASRRRLRHLLFKVDYSRAVSVTLTRPNNVGATLLQMCEPESAFDELGKHVSRLPFVRSLIWRKEVTKQGMPHYHCILIPGEDVEPLQAGKMLVDSWIRQLLSSTRTYFGPGAQALVENQLQSLEKDMRKAHSDARRPSVKAFDDKMTFVRYILDHQSKHKRYQAKTTGRAWGVWNRKQLPLSSFEFEDLTEKEFFALGRCLRKMCRYQVKHEQCPFGWKHSYGRKVQKNGVTDYFGLLADGSLASKIRAYLASMREGVA